MRKIVNCLSAVSFGRSRGAFCCSEKCIAGRSLRSRRSFRATVPGKATPSRASSICPSGTPQHGSCRTAAYRARYDSYLLSRTGISQITKKRNLLTKSTTISIDLKMMTTLKTCDILCDIFIQKFVIFSFLTVFITIFGYTPKHKEPHKHWVFSIYTVLFRFYQ